MINYFKSAFSSIWSNKARSLLTVLGVVIGVTSVTTLIALSQGLKNDVSSIIQGMGTNIIAVIGGKLDPDDPDSSNINPANFIASDILTTEDLASIENNPRVESATPMVPISKLMKFDSQSANPLVMGVYPNILDSLQILKIEKGKMFAQGSSANEIVISKGISKKFFPDVDPIGQTIMLGEDQFTVIGILGRPINSTALGNEYNNMSFIPFDTATRINKNEIKILRIMLKVKDSEDVKVAKSEIHNAILANHKGDENFSVLTQDDFLNILSEILDLITTLVSAIAAISLVVGGIGIMNIMLVTVTERTKEIGLRKAVGATKGAILFQFLVEAIIITLLGGLIGLAFSIIAAYIVKAKTTLNPAITLDIVLIAIGISTAIGIIFGLWPALRAANKDPIEALRYE